MYILIGTIHSMIIVMIQRKISKKVNLNSSNQDTSKYLTKILIEIFLWPIIIIIRIFKYEEMRETLKFVEEKLDSYFEDEIND